MKPCFSLCLRICQGIKQLALFAPLLTTPLYCQTVDDFNSGANDTVYASALQPDGKILVAGWFNMLGGKSREYIGRLNADGTLDAGFNPVINDSVFCVVVKSDGKILVGGSFTMIGGQSCNYLARLNTDGTFDTSFNASLNGQAESLSEQSDGKILVGGEFTSLGGQRHNYIGRLNADGTLDTSFNSSADSSVNCLALQADGKILASGFFYTMNGQDRSHIARLNADGSLDANFNPGANNNVLHLALQGDGKILVGGSFTTLASQSRNCIGRLNGDGTLDTSFNPGANGAVESVVLQADGKILLAGFFTVLSGRNRGYIGRLNADGSLDESFTSEANGYVYSLALQSDGKSLAGGTFTAMGGQNHSYLVRLKNTEPATQHLALDGSALTWIRGGSSPEIWRTTFEYTPDSGTTWTYLGFGNRIPGGWQLGALALPTNTTFRARGWTQGGRFSNSGWLIESVIGPPAIYTQPLSLTNNAGTTALFKVYAVGDVPISYQWLKEGGSLTNVGNTSGTTTPCLTMSNVLEGDAGIYSLLVSNAAGSLISSIATLKVIEPVINVQLVGGVVNQGENTILGLTAVGTPPLRYQWRHDDVLQSDVTGSSLTISNLQPSDAGNYVVVVSSAWGSATSAVAVLTVNSAAPDSFNPGANNDVDCLAVQADGKILLGGGFTILGGQGRGYLARINADGTLDTSFNPAANGYVRSLALQPDGKILVGGSFHSLGGSTPYIARLNADGTPDISFNPLASGGIFSVVLQSDGRILVGGSFSSLGGMDRNNIGRLNADGTLDVSFNPGADDTVYSLAMQPDGKILVGGSFRILGGRFHRCIGRLNPEGTVDASLYLPAEPGVISLAVQADGKILAAGFYSIGFGLGPSYMCRLHADGTLDEAFNPRLDNYPLSQVLQADGKILLGGTFTTLGGQSRTNLGRLNADGTLDASFCPGVATEPAASVPFVHSLALQPDGKVLVGGWFERLAGQSRECIGRLRNTESGMQNLTFDGSNLTWMRGGTTPEIWRATFEYSPDHGTSWTDIGAGVRIPGGWQLAGTILPSKYGTFRARGYTVGGCCNASSWFVETVLQQLPVVTAIYAAGQSLVVQGTNGVANGTYYLLSSTNLGLPMANWTCVATNTFDSNGNFSSTNRWALPSQQQFFMLRLP